MWIKSLEIFIKRKWDFHFQTPAQRSLTNRWNWLSIRAFFCLSLKHTISVYKLTGRRVCKCLICCNTVWSIWFNEWIKIRCPLLSLVLAVLRGYYSAAGSEVCSAMITSPEPGAAFLFFFSLSLPLLSNPSASFNPQATFSSWWPLADWVFTYVISAKRF